MGNNHERNHDKQYSMKGVINWEKSFDIWEVIVL